MGTRESLEEWPIARPRQRRHKQAKAGLFRGAWKQEETQRVRLCQKEKAAGGEAPNGQLWNNSDH